MLRTEVVLDGLDRLRGPWQDLWANAAFATPFQTFDWMESWLSAYGRFGRPHVVCVYDGNDLVGLWPLMRFRRPWPILRSMGIGPSDYLHPIIAQDRFDQVYGVFMDYLSDLKDWTVDLHQLRTDAPLGQFELDGGVYRKQAACLVLDLPDTYDAYLATLSKSLRYDAKRISGKALTDKNAKFIDADSSNLGACLDAFFELHKARWRKRGLPGAFFGKAVRFQKEWTAKAIKQGWLWLRLLEADGRVVGAIYTMRGTDTCFFYQAGFDPDYKALSPGTLLVASMIERSIQEGLTRFDFLRGDEPYKRRWKPQHSFENRRLIIPASNPTGSLAARSLHAAANIEDRLRERFEGKSLLKS